MQGGRSWHPCCPCHAKKIATPPEQIHLRRIADIGTRSRPGKVLFGGTSRDASSNGPSTARPNNAAPADTCGKVTDDIRRRCFLPAAGSAGGARESGRS